MHRVDKIQLLGMMSHRILPANTTITIWTKMQVQIFPTNLLANMNSYLWKLSRLMSTHNCENNTGNDKIQYHLETI